MGFMESYGLIPDDYHLDLDAPPLAECDRCHRQTWDVDNIGQVCAMPQPSGDRCLGVFTA